MSVLFVDTNLGIDHALAVAKAEGGKVFYHIPWQTAFPKLQDSVTGDGFDELIKVSDMSSVMDRVNTVVFTDIGFAGTIEELKSEGYKVWGAPKEVERLETDRIFMREKLNELGVKTTEGKVFKGVNAIMKFVRENKGQHWIKINKFRGNVETFSCDNELSAQAILSRGNFGCYTDEIDFIVEENLDLPEIGCDCFFNGRRFLDKHLFTIEHKGVGNTTKWVERSLFTERFMRPLEGWLEEQGFCGSLCVEGFWDGEDFFACDITARFPFPNSTLWRFTINDYARFIKGIASGEIDDFDVRATYSTELGILTDDVDGWRKLSVDWDVIDGRNRGIGWRRVVKKDDEYYAAPGESLVCTVLGIGDNERESFDNAVKAADAVSGYKILVASDSNRFFEQTIEKIRDAEKYEFREKNRLTGIVEKIISQYHNG